MKKKILVIPNSLENLSDILKTNVDGIILSIKDLSVNSNVYFTIDDIKSIINIFDGCNGVDVKCYLGT